MHKTTLAYLKYVTVTHYYTAFTYSHSTYFISHANLENYSLILDETKMSLKTS